MSEDPRLLGTLDVLAEALWERIRAITLAAHRLDRLPENQGGVAAAHGEEVEKLAEEFLFRLLRLGTDPVNYAILSRLAREASFPLVELAGEVQLPALAVSERVADLVQVGLAARSLIGDHVQATAATAAFVGLIQSLVQALGKRITEEWATALEGMRL
ncbi:MAG: hypothetical protein QN198_01640 [Armatimonadota bacterium]|nr:hypothetical protein [Armatimonadota bacterium]MDR5702288.1 hypothetical protein [Armatimonadota bacterium]MDR7435409.1 hypothetical protein [Armatimonadota bacterium]